MLVSFGGAAEWPGVVFTCRRRVSAPFSETETLWGGSERALPFSPHLNSSIGPQADLHSGLRAGRLASCHLKKTVLSEGEGKGEPRMGQSSGELKQEE